jgi:hypothetical protein
VLLAFMRLQPSQLFSFMSFHLRNSWRHQLTGTRIFFVYFIPLGHTPFLRWHLVLPSFKIRGLGHSSRSKWLCWRRRRRFSTTKVWEETVLASVNRNRPARNHRGRTCSNELSGEFVACMMPLNADISSLRVPQHIFPIPSRSAGHPPWAFQIGLPESSLSKDREASSARLRLQTRSEASFHMVETHCMDPDRYGAATESGRHSAEGAGRMALHSAVLLKSTSVLHDIC